MFLINSGIFRKRKKNFILQRKYNYILADRIQFISKDIFALLKQNYESIFISLSRSHVADYGHYITVKMKAVCLHMLRPIYKSSRYSNVLWGAIKSNLLSW